MPTEFRDDKKPEIDGQFNKNFYLKTTIKGVDVEPYSTVATIIIREWIFDLLPRLEMEIVDRGRFTDQFPLEDNDEIHIELNNIRSRDPVVDIDFSLQDYEISNDGDKEFSIIKITAILKTSDIVFPIHNRSFANKNSKEVFQQIANDSGLDFESLVQPQDSMTWLQINKNNCEFINHVINRAHSRDDDALFCYIDRHNKMNYRSIISEIANNNEPKKFQLKPGASVLNSANYTDKELEERLEAEKEDTPNTYFYFNWNYKNIAGMMNKKNSYGREYNYYDVANTSESNTTKIMDSDWVPLSKHSLKEKENVGKIVKHNDLGFFDKSNTFGDKYMQSLIQNKYVKNNFFSSALIVYSRPDPEINLFDVIDIAVPTAMKLDTTTDEVHSGSYIVGGILHHADTQALFDDVLILFRNGSNIRGYLEDFQSRHSEG